MVVINSLPASNESAGEPFTGTSSVGERLEHSSSLFMVAFRSDRSRPLALSAIDVTLAGV